MNLLVMVAVAVAAVIFSFYNHHHLYALFRPGLYFSDYCFHCLDCDYQKDNYDDSDDGDPLSLTDVDNGDDDHHGHRRYDRSFVFFCLSDHHRMVCDLLFVSVQSHDHGTTMMRMGECQTLGFCVSGF